ncbi:hypothetical protein [Microbulbifer sp. THAF38]|uniref:hypothetical protein n=1 Tax=Microbulbifer sp. THAF38 TaxID=2587856 RepID=UPI0012691BFB|nr:hypothetical protein [Microbulbifer sp. THAF38]QFT56619.1 hypothetical protein FIU95_18890 [Microbulbifer sp. THAF38]
MNRFAVFSGSYNLQIGGVADFKESYPTKADAKKKAEEIARDNFFVSWIQIFDKVTDEFSTYSVVDRKLKKRNHSCNTSNFRT